MEVGQKVRIVSKIEKGKPFSEDGIVDDLSLLRSTMWVQIAGDRRTFRWNLTTKRYEHNGGNFCQWVEPAE